MHPIYISSARTTVRTPSHRRSMSTTAMFSSTRCAISESDLVTAAPFELFTQQLEIGALGRFDDVQRARCAADADAIARPQRETGLSVERDEYLVLSFHDWTKMHF